MSSHEEPMRWPLQAIWREKGGRVARVATHAGREPFRSLLSPPMEHLAAHALTLGACSDARWPVLARAFVVQARQELGMPGATLPVHDELSEALAHLKAQVLALDATDARDSLVSSLAQLHARAARSAPMSRQDAALLRDVIFALQGVDGHFMRFDTETDSYVLDGDMAALSLAQRHLILRVTSAGVLYRHAVEALEFLRNRNKNEVKISFIEQVRRFFEFQGLVAAATSELRSYLTIVSQLEAQVHCTDPQKRLTLRRLVAWTMAPLRSLKLLNDILQTYIVQCKAENHHASSIFLLLVKYTHHGDATVAALAQRLVAASSLPVYQILARWAVEGDLCDPHGDCFLEKMPRAEDSFAFWTTSHTMTASPIHRPPGISPFFASKILRAGKNIVCARQFGIELPPSEPLFALEAIEIKLRECKSCEEMTAVLESIVEHVSLAYESFVAHKVLEKSNIRVHLDALRALQCLGDGEFLRELLRRLSQDLDRPYVLLHRHALQVAVDACVHAARLDEVFPDKALRVVLASHADHDHFVKNPEEAPQGWAVFSLRYQVHPPADLFLFNKIIDSFQKIFECMWKIARAEKALHVLWLSYSKCSRMLASFSEAQFLIHRTYLLRREMAYFVESLWSYFSTNVIFCELRELQTKEFNTIDECIESIQATTNSILSKLLLTDEHEAKRRVVDSIIDLVMRFFQEQMDFMTNAEKAYGGKVARVASVSDDGMDVVDTDGDADEGLLEVFLHDVSGTYLDRYNHDFKQFRDYLTLLDIFRESTPGRTEVDPSPSDADMAPLSFKLNYNGFYSTVLRSLDS